MTSRPSFTASTVPSAAEWQTLLSLGTVKTSNENRISTATMADDAVLRADYNTNATYEITGLLIHNSSSTADFKFQIADTGSASLVYLSVLAIISGGSSPVITEGTSGTVFTGEGASANRSMWIRGSAVISSTPGAFKVQWAQNTSTASTTGLQAGSFFLLRQVG